VAGGGSPPPTTSDDPTPNRTPALESTGTGGFTAAGDRERPPAADGVVAAVGVVVREEEAGEGVGAGEGADVPPHPPSHLLMLRRPPPCAAVLAAVAACSTTSAVPVAHFIKAAPTSAVLLPAAPEPGTGDNVSLADGVPPATSTAGAMAGVALKVVVTRVVVTVMPTAARNMESNSSGWCTGCGCNDGAGSASTRVDTGVKGLNLTRCCTTAAPLSGLLAASAPAGAAGCGGKSKSARKRVHVSVNGGGVAGMPLRSAVRAVAVAGSTTRN